MDVREALASRALSLKLSLPTAGPSSRRPTLPGADRDAQDESVAETVTEAVAEEAVTAPCVFPVLVTLDLSKDGLIQEDMHSALCLGPVTNLELLDLNPEVVGFSLENLSLFTEEGVLICLGGCVQF